MNILVIGGTEFLGRHFVEAAKDKHNLTLFNRGKTNINLFSDVETVIGDRKSDLGPLKNRKFDAVLDTCGYFPQNIQNIINFLKQNVEKYVFVSSCSVYDHNNKNLDSFDENAPLVDLNVDVNDESWETYGARKYLCEEVVRESFPQNHFIIRPGLIVGPYDPTYRFPYWADRFSEGGTVIAPGSPEAPLQFIDARDLSQWILHGIESNICGTYNTVSPHGELTLGVFLEKVKSVINPNCNVTWVSEKFLRDHKVSCWSQLPLWVYEEIQGFLKVNSGKAIAMGLKFRSIEQSIRDTHEWSKDIYRGKYLNKVLSRGKEKELLSLYNSL